MPRTGKPSKRNRCSSLTKVQSLRFSDAIIEAVRRARRRPPRVDGDNGGMNDTDFDLARAELAGARRDARAIAAWPAARIPSDLAEAYRLQAAVASELGAIGGWKVAAVTPAQRESLGVPVPIAGPLLRRWMHDARAAAPTLSAAGFIAPKLECEFAFELARDLPPRPARPYSRDEVRAAVAALRIAVEIVDSRLPRGLGALAELADAFNNGAFVAGPARRRLARARPGADRDRPDAQPRRHARRGRARQRQGDPRRRSVRHRRAARQRTGGRERAGSSPAPSSRPARARARRCLPGPGDYRAEFATLGSVEFRFTA